MRIGTVTHAGQFAHRDDRTATRALLRDLAARTPSAATPPTP